MRALALPHSIHKKFHILNTIEFWKHLMKMKN